MTNPCNAPPPHSLSIGVVCENMVIRRESSDDYFRVLIQFLAEWRLIQCKHGTQWVVQSRSTKKPNVGTWVGRKHAPCPALLVVCSALNLIRDQSVAQKVLALPEKVTGGSQNG